MIYLTPEMEVLHNDACLSVSPSVTAIIQDPLQGLCPIFAQCWITIF